ncbi:MAG: POTRA domain-containing protein, partial [Bryobacteraceae bacterium]
MQRRAVVLLWLALPAPSVPARAAEAELPVKAVRFVPEQQPYPRQRLLELVPFKPGEPLKPGLARTAIERLFATGRFADIRVEAWPLGEGWEIRIVTEPAFFVGRVTAEGPPGLPSASALATAARLDLGAPFDTADLPPAEENLRRALQNHGFFEPRIRHRLEYDPKTQQVNIRFEIESGPRARYAPPEVSGSPERPLNKLVKVTRWKGWLCWKPVTESRTQDGLERLRRSYQKEDRLAARVTLTGMKYQPETKRAQPRLEINAGPRIRVEVEGA